MHMRPDNCVEYYLIAVDYHMEPVRAQAQSEILSNLQVCADVSSSACRRGSKRRACLQTAVTSTHWPRLCSKPKLVTQLLAPGAAHDAYFLGILKGKLPNRHAASVRRARARCSRLFSRL